MEQVADVMQNALERPVVDQTGLTGKYDFVLKWTSDENGSRVEVQRVPITISLLDEAGAPTMVWTHERLANQDCGRRSEGG